MCCRTRYAHCVSADLYHIEFERSENISNLLQGKYIEPNITYRVLRRHIDKIKIASVNTKAVLAKKKGRGILAISRPFPVGKYMQFHTTLPQARGASLFFISYGAPCRTVSVASGRHPSDPYAAVNTVVQMPIQGGSLYCLAIFYRR